MSRFSIIPVESENHEGRQWGYTIEDERGETIARCWTGGTGPCWNVLFGSQDEDETAVHFCEIDDAIEMLIALRDSQANAQNKAQWE